MKIKKISVLISFFLNIIFCFSESVNLKIDSEAYMKKIKILVLVIASDEIPVYIEFQKLWRSYMNYNPEQVEVYFIKSDPNFADICEIKEDIIWSKGRESMIPGILNKTILSMEFLMPRIKTEFDYVLRTNLSSVWIFPKLLNFLETAPKKNFFSGAIIWDEIISGSGMIFSSDLAEFIVKNKNQLFNNTRFNDDAVISYFLSNNGIKKIDYPMLNIVSKNDWNDIISIDCSHFRIKGPDNLRAIDDAYIYRQLIDKFY